MAPTQSASPNLPWYRQSWPWLLLIMPAVAVCVSIVLMWLAMRSPDPLVQEQYYVAGQSINEMIHAGHRAEALRLSGELRLDFSDGRVQIKLNNPRNIILSPALRLQLTHPTLPTLDQKLVVAMKSPGSYEGSLPITQAHRWNILLSDPTNAWSLSADWRQAEGNQTKLVPTAIYNPADER